MNRPVRLWHLAVTVALVSLVVGAGTAVAGGSFADVAPEDPFYGEIEAIADAGITTGYGDGTYRPGASVSRGAMAAFMGRGFSRASGASGTLTDPQDTFTYGIAGTQVTAGAASGSGGYVVVTGHASMNSRGPNCPCAIDVSVTDGEETSTVQRQSGDEDEESGVSGVDVSAGATHVFSLDAGETEYYTVRASTYTAGTDQKDVVGELTAIYVPFDGSGNAP